MTNEINENDLINDLKSDTSRKRFDDFNNGKELFKKIKSGEMKREEAKKLQNVFKLDLSVISRGRYKSGEQKSVLENIKLFYESQEPVIKLINDYFSIVSEAKYKTIHGEGSKISTPNQILQILSIALAQVKVGKASENLLNEINYIFFLSSKKNY